MTTAQKGGKVFNLTHRPHLPPGNPPGTHFYMVLSLYDEVTNVLCVSLLSHDRYQYDSLILSSDTGGLPELLPLHKQPVA